LDVTFFELRPERW